MKTNAIKTIFDIHIHSNQKNKNRKKNLATNSIYIVCKYLFVLGILRCVFLLNSSLAYATLEQEKIKKLLLAVKNLGNKREKVCGAVCTTTHK